MAIWGILKEDELILILIANYPKSEIRDVVFGSLILYN
jgi:hypothetical protein